MPSAYANAGPPVKHTNNNFYKPNLEAGVQQPPQQIKMYADEEEPLYECGSCSRKFKLVVLEKHEKVCQKVFQEKRKVFKTSEKRIVSKEQKELVKRNEKLAKKAPANKKEVPFAKMPKWK